MSTTVHVQRVENGFTLEAEANQLIVVEGTNPRTVAAKLGRAVIKALAEKGAAPNEQ